MTTQTEKLISPKTNPVYLYASSLEHKIELVLQRINNIIQHQSETIENIVFLTQTNKDSQHLYNTLIGKQMQNPDEYEFEIYSIHSFCEQILRQYGLYLGISPDFKVKSLRCEMDDIISDEVGKNSSNPLLFGIPENKISKMVDILISSAETQNIFVNKEILQTFHFDSKNNDFWNDFKKLYMDISLGVHEKLEHLKSIENVFTTNDLILKVVELLKNEKIAREIAKIYHYIFVLQTPVNILHKSIIKTFSDIGINVNVIEDKIYDEYSFNGVIIENDYEMSSSLLAQIGHENLLLNMDVSLSDSLNRMFSEPFTYLGKPLDLTIKPLKTLRKPTTTENDSFNIIFGYEIPNIISKIITEEIDGQTPSLEDIAVICKTNSEIENITECLKKAGYPVRVLGGKSFFRTKELIDTYKIIKTVVCHDKKYRSELIFTDYYKSLEFMPVKINFSDFLSELEIVSRGPLPALMIYLYNRSGILKYYNKHRDSQAVSNLEKLNGIAFEHTNIIDFLEYLHDMIFNKQYEDNAGLHSGINIIAASKLNNQTFPIVVISNVDNKLDKSLSSIKLILDIKADKSILAINKESLSGKLTADKEFATLGKDKMLKDLVKEVHSFATLCRSAEHKLILSCSNPLSFTVQNITIGEFASIPKWLCQIDGGQFISKYRRFYEDVY